MQHQTNNRFLTLASLLRASKPDPSFLLSIARRAEAYLRYDLLPDISTALTEAGQYDAAEYFNSIAVAREGEASRQAATLSLERPALYSSSEFRARSLFSLGTFSVMTGDNRLGLKFYREAARFVSDS